MGRPVAVRYEKCSARGRETVGGFRPPRPRTASRRWCSISWISSRTGGLRAPSCTRWRGTRRRCAASPAPGSSARPVLAALQEAERRGVTVPAHHRPRLHSLREPRRRCTPSATPRRTCATKFGEDLKSEDPEAAILVEDLKGFGLPAWASGSGCCSPPRTGFFVYPTKLREYQARYRGSFLHGASRRKK